MNHKQRRTLHSLFAHPISIGIDPSRIYSRREAGGAEISEGVPGRIVVKPDGNSHGFHDRRQALSTDEVTAPQKFLKAAGIHPPCDMQMKAITA